MVVRITSYLVYILSLYAITFSLHAILDASSTYNLPRSQNKEHLPVLLCQLLHQRIVDLGAHWRQNTFVRYRTIEYLFDGCASNFVSDFVFRNLVRVETPFVTWKAQRWVFMWHCIFKIITVPNVVQERGETYRLRTVRRPI